MPNWAEGTMKIRGTRNNIVKFLSEGLQAVDINGDDTKLTVEQDEVWGEYVTSLIISQDTYRIHVKGTHRAFIIPDSDAAYLNNDDVSIIEFDFVQAWSVNPESFKELSLQYHIDFHIFTFEKEHRFTQEIEIIKGKLTKNTEAKYGNYQWEVPFSKLGG